MIFTLRDGKNISMNLGIIIVLFFSVEYSSLFLIIQNQWISGDIADPAMVAKI